MSLEQERTVEINVRLSEDEAMALAQFVKRIGFSECLQLAVNAPEAALMREGCHRIEHALSVVGYSPR